MTENTAPHRGTIVRPVDTPRRAAAERAVAAKLAEVATWDSRTWPAQLLAGLYATAALEADDAHAAGRGVVTQHHGIGRNDLAAVLELAARAVDGQHAEAGRIHGDCAECRRLFALGRVRNALEWTAGPSRAPAT